jgi:hypothetical protein
MRNLVRGMLLALGLVLAAAIRPAGAEGAKSAALDYALAVLSDAREPADRCAQSQAGTERAPPGAAPGEQLAQGRQCPPGYPVDCGTGVCCPGGTFCAGGRLCCPSGSTACGNTCCAAGNYCAAPGACCANGKNLCVRSRGCCPGNLPHTCPGNPRCFATLSAAVAGGCRMADIEVCGRAVR